MFAGNEIRYFFLFSNSECMIQAETKNVQDYFADYRQA